MPALEEAVVRNGNSGALVLATGSDVLEAFMLLPPFLEATLRADNLETLNEALRRNRGDVVCSKRKCWAELLERDVLRTDRSPAEPARSSCAALMTVSELIAAPESGLTGVYRR